MPNRADTTAGRGTHRANMGPVSAVCIWSTLTAEAGHGCRHSPVRVSAEETGVATASGGGGILAGTGERLVAPLGVGTERSTPMLTWLCYRSSKTTLHGPSPRLSKTRRRASCAMSTGAGYVRPIDVGTRFRLVRPGGVARYSVLGARCSVLEGPPTGAPRTRARPRDVAGGPSGRREKSREGWWRGALHHRLREDDAWSCAGHHLQDRSDQPFDPVKNTVQKPQDEPRDDGDEDQGE